MRGGRKTTGTVGLDTLFEQKLLRTQTADDLKVTQQGHIATEAVNTNFFHQVLVFQKRNYT